MFFKVTVNAACGEIKRIKKEKKGYIHKKTDEFNSSDGEVRACLSEIYDTFLDVLVIIPFRRKEEAGSTACEYLRYIGVASEEEWLLEEVDGSSFYASLLNADRYDFVDSGEFLRTRSVSRLVHGDGVSDYLIKPFTSAPLISSSLPSLREEIKRINSSSRSIFYGHPVHYIFLMDSSDVIDYSLSLLLSALYDKGRLISRRVVSICRKKDLTEPDETPGYAILRPAECAYETNGGGTVVLFPSSFKEGEEKKRSSEFLFDDFISLLKTNTRDVLSVVVLPRSREKDATAIINEMRGVCSFVVITESGLPEEDVVKYLKKRAKEDKVSRYSKVLISEYLASNEMSSYDEVNRFYDSWYKRVLIDKLYPEYKEYTEGGCVLEKETSPDTESSYSKLHSLIGLESVKALIDEVINLNKYNKLLLERNKKVINISRHMVFTGNPGTAKTTVARLFAGIMKEEGILDKGDLIEVGRKDIVAKYVGWTAKNVEKIFQCAKGSVLFIDEAYSLVDDRSGSFADEAINTIVQCMENYRHDTIVIFAGYPEKMASFLDRNPGLRSRISYNINFEDYSDEELYSILLLMCKEDGVEISSECRAKVMSIIEEGKRASDFGNGRFIRNIYDKARVKAVNRLMRSGSFGDVVLEAEDFPLLEEKEARRNIGFDIV